MSEFDELKSFVMFVGNERSGTSIIAALMTAHPNIVCSNNCKLGQYSNWIFSHGFQKGRHSREQCFRTIIDRATKGNIDWLHRRVSDKNWIKNSYRNQTKDLQIIGDQRALKTSDILRRKKDLRAALNQVSIFLELPIKFIECVRNPFDVLTRFSQLGGGNRRRPLGHNHNSGLVNYVESHKIAQEVEKVALIDKNIGFHRIYQEQLISDPRKTLQELSGFLEIEPHPDWVNGGCSVVFDKPHKTRDDHNWTPAEKEIVLDNIAQYETLRHYAF